MTELAVELYGTRLGVLTGERNEFQFAATSEGIDRFGLGSTVLSLAVPLLSTAPRRPRLVQNFFEEVLSEGATREQLALNARLDSTNTMALLARYGRDVAGSLQIWDPTDPAEPRIPEARPVTDAQIAAMFNEVRTNPLGNKGRRRLSSLAGVQDKVLLARVGGEWAEPLDGYPSTHILKPRSGRHLSLIFDEEYGSRFARGVGLATFETRIGMFDGHPALVVERYDRDEAGERVHQEDFNQVLGHRGDEKYEPTTGDGRLRAIAASLREHAGSREVRKLVTMMTVSTALGNLDMHAKNISIIHAPDGSVSLAPMYDVVPQLHLDVDPDVALQVNGKYEHREISGADLVAEAESWRVRDAREIVGATLEQVHGIARSEKPLPGAHPDLDRMIDRITQRLIESIDAPSSAGDARAKSGAEARSDEVFPSRTAGGGWGGPVRN